MLALAPLLGSAPAGPVATAEAVYPGANGAISAVYLAEDPGDEVDNAGGTIGWARFLSPGGRRLRALDASFARACYWHDCTDASFSPGGREVVSVGEGRNGDAVVWLSRFPPRRRMREVVLRIPGIDSSQPAAPVYGPTGRLAVVETLYGFRTLRGRIWTVNRAGREVKKLGAGREPDWSRRGQLAFTRAGGIWVMDGDGRRPRRIRAHGSSPEWSPDGRAVVYSDRGDIVITSTSGIVLRRLTAGKATDRYPVWSPDGRQIAFVRSTGRDRVHFVPATGGVATPRVGERAFEDVLDFVPYGTELRITDWQSRR